MDLAHAGLEIDPPERRLQTGAVDDPRVLHCAGWHWRLVRVRLQDDTDHHNELVHVDEWLLHRQERLLLAGNLFVLRIPRRRAV
ncbi:MAG: hypothetical protein ACOCXJ_06075 [Planctomycetota bacterium]